MPVVTMDLNKIAHKKKPVQATGSTAEGPVSGLTLEKLPIERMGEYGKIHTEHVAKAGGSRKAKGEAELEFFNAFFNCYWSKNVTTKLLQNHLLQSDIKTLGFDPLINPILAFFLNPFTKELLENGLLDKIKYKAIHNAVAKHLMAESEYVKENNYNILYCLDLYNKTAADIETYLAYQKSVLMPSMKKYSDKTKARNIQIFLVNGSENMQSANAKLNALEDIQEIIEKVTGKSLSTDKESDTSQKADNSHEKFVQLVNQIDSEAGIVAFLQYISMNAGHSIVRDTLAKFISKVPAEALLRATGEISALTTDYLSNKRLTKTEAKELLDLLLDRYKRVS